MDPATPQELFPINEEAEIEPANPFETPDPLGVAKRDINQELEPEAPAKKVKHEQKVEESTGDECGGIKLQLMLMRAKSKTNEETLINGFRHLVGSPLKVFSPKNLRGINLLIPASGSEDVCRTTELATVVLYLDLGCGSGLSKSHLKNSETIKVLGNVATKKKA